MATDADPLSDIALAGNLDLFPAQRTDSSHELRAFGNTLRAAAQPPQLAALSDEELVELVRKQDSAALDILFCRHSRLVYSIALRILRDSGEAEEVVQESFLYMFRKALNFDVRRGSARIWIVQIAYSRARDRKAHLSRRGFYCRIEIEKDGLEGILANDRDLERQVEARLDFRSLRTAFEELSDKQRKTLELYYFDDLDLREISEKLREPLGNVRHFFYRGLERLRKSATAERLRAHCNVKY